MLDTWQKRPPEEANHFNPAFIGSLLYELAKEYGKHKPAGVPITYAAISLAIVLHRPTRQRLPYSTVTSLYEWIQDNEDLLIGFVSRARGVRPYLQEGVRFGLSNHTLAMDGSHGIVVGDIKAHFPAAFMRETTVETKEVIDRIKFLARWLAKSGSESSILASWGVCP